MSGSYETKRALAESLKTIMRKAPFSRVTVDGVCEQACVSRRNFYRYFPDKYELLNWLYEDDFCAPLREKNIPRSMDLIPYVCAHLYQNKTFFLNAFDVKEQNSFRDFCKGRLYRYLERDYGQAFSSKEAAEGILSWSSLRLKDMASSRGNAHRGIIGNGDAFHVEKEFKS